MRLDVFFRKIKLPNKHHKHAITCKIISIPSLVFFWFSITILSHTYLINEAHSSTLGLIDEVTN